jgi:hypothetical protein
MVAPMRPEANVCNVAKSSKQNLAPSCRQEKRCVSNGQAKGSVRPAPLTNAGHANRLGARARHSQLQCFR